MNRASIIDTISTLITTIGMARAICENCPPVRSSGAKAAMVVNTPTTTGARTPVTPRSAACAP